MAEREGTSRVEDAITSAAESLGKFLGQITNEVESFATRRKDLTAQLTQIRDKASELLASLGEATGRGYAVARHSRPAPATVALAGKRLGQPRKARGGGRKGLKASAATRATISASKRARGAKPKS